MSKPYRLYAEKCSELPELRIASTARVVGLMLRFGLARRDAELALLLADGMDLVEAGRTIKLSEDTTRTCYKRIYQQLGIHTQAQLVGVVYKAILEAMASIQSEPRPLSQPSSCSA